MVEVEGVEEGTSQLSCRSAYSMVLLQRRTRGLVDYECESVAQV